jgi:general secretion pathway protein H
MICVQRVLTGEKAQRTTSAMNKTVARSGTASEPKGFTVLELMVVIAIVLFVSAAVVASVQSLRQASLSTQSDKLAVSIRYLYDLAALNNTVYKLVIDMGSNAYWGEEVSQNARCGSAILPSEREALYSLDTETEPAVPSKGAQEGSSATKENLLTRTTLPKGLSFGGVMTSHQDELQEEGKANIYFFPSGYVEKALIYINKGETTYTIETHPLKGIGILHTEKIDPRRLLD